MNEIHVLDNHTVDKIAAGEVVERPFSIVKELVENAIDAGAGHVTVEIKDGGISMIRVTDDGSGIDKSQLTKAFLRHATSKIKEAEDLSHISSLGFRGEALSSIAAVCQVELITKTEEELTGQHFTINGGEAGELEEIGAPKGTTVIARNIFYNTPVRKKFLKTAMTEGNYIADFMQHIALSAPQIAFQYIANGQTKFFTSGNGDSREVIYRIYGKETANQLLPISAQMDGISVKGFLGKPILCRANRAFETIFVNGRYIKSSLVCSAVEEGYRTFLMQHKYPFVVLYLTIDPEKIDVNVHPTKMDIRINEPQTFFRFLQESVAAAINGRSLVTSMDAKIEKEEDKKAEKQLTREIPQPFEAGRRSQSQVRETSSYGQSYGQIVQKALQKVDEELAQPAQSSVREEKTGYTTFGSDVRRSSTPEKKQVETAAARIIGTRAEYTEEVPKSPIIKKEQAIIVEKPQQMALFTEDDLKKQQVENFEIIGQVFDTYWILALADKIYYVDQHAAHEKVNYERFVKRLHEKTEIPSQQLSPPTIVTLTPKEQTAWKAHEEHFTRLGFELEEFGEDAVAIRAVPLDLYGNGEKELLLSVLDELVQAPAAGDSFAVLSKIASMSCKAAVKGNQKLSLSEIKVLMQELLACDNPYNCPHGRPTIISMSKYELERKFKR